MEAVRIRVVWIHRSVGSLGSTPQKNVVFDLNKPAKRLFKPTDLCSPFGSLTIKSKYVIGNSAFLGQWSEPPLRNFDLAPALSSSWTQHLLTVIVSHGNQSPFESH